MNLLLTFSRQCEPNLGHDIQEALQRFAPLAPIELGRLRLDHVGLGRPLRGQLVHQESL